MASVRPFHRYRGETSFTIDRFIGILREQLPLVAPSQTKYRVTEIPSERTIRFYTARRLVDKPVVGAGARARYGYRHLLQVMAIKYLQSQYLPLVKIRSLVDNISNRDLELLIPEISTAPAAHRGIAREERPVVEDRLYPQRYLFEPKRSVETAPAVEGTRVAAYDDAWRRIEIGPGIELHVHAAALSERDVEQLRGSLLRELGILRGWFGGEKK
jgi:DNA-binding transcriptional MerR regulator